MKPKFYAAKDQDPNTFRGLFGGLCIEELEQKIEEGTRKCYVENNKNILIMVLDLDDHGVLTLLSKNQDELFSLLWKLLYHIYNKDRELRSSLSVLESVELNQFEEYLHGNEFSSNLGLGVFDIGSMNFIAEGDMTYFKNGCFYNGSLYTNFNKQDIVTFLDNYLDYCLKTMNDTAKKLLHLKKVSRN